MSDDVTELNDENFEEMTSKGKWVIDFWAAWCGPCRMMAPYFEAAAKEMKGKVNFGKVDVESNPQISERFQIMSIPTLIVFDKGEQINRASGAMPKDEILSLIEDSNQ